MVAVKLGEPGVLWTAYFVYRFNRQKLKVFVTELIHINRACRCKGEVVDWIRAR